MIKFCYCQLITIMMNSSQKESGKFSAQQVVSIKSMQTMRENFTKTIRRQKNDINNNSKRKQIIEKIEAQYSDLPKQIWLKDLYIIGLETNRLSFRVSSILRGMSEFWEKGKIQNYYLRILGNILCDDITEQNISEVSSTVRASLVPQFESVEFVKSASFFFKKLFKWHNKLFCYEQYDDQILNEETFIPMIQVMLNNFPNSKDQYNLIKSVQYLFEQQEPSLNSHYKVKRNYRVITMIMNHHLKIIHTQRNQKLQQSCLLVYLSAVRGYMKACEFMRTDAFVQIARNYLCQDFGKVKMILVAIFERIFQFQQTERILNQFIQKQFLPYILNERIQMWLGLVFNISQNSTCILNCHLRQILPALIKTFKDHEEIKLLELSIGILKELMFCEKQSPEKMSFCCIFQSMDGFGQLERINLMKTEEIAMSIQQLLVYRDIVFNNFQKN